MKKNFTILAIVTALALFAFCNQHSTPNPADKFLNYLNNYQVDSLQIVIADNFQLERTFSARRNDRNSFIEKYVPDSKNFNGKYKVLKRTASQQTTEFLVEDQSDYFKYLAIDYPRWVIKIFVNKQDKVERVLIDTTDSYQTYLTQVKEKSDQFESWIKQKYPNEVDGALYTTPGILTKRLKEYSGR